MLRLVLAVLCIGCLFGAGAVVLLQSDVAADPQTELMISQGLIEAPPEISESVTVRLDESDANLTRKVNFEELKAINPDVYGWVYLPDTNVDYYVMQEPEGLPEGEYQYIWKDIYKRENKWGSIFTPFVPDGGPDAVTLFFGHRMKDKSLGFSNLKLFLEQEYLDAHPYVYVYYPEYSERWRIWAACNADYMDEVYRIRPVYQKGMQDYADLISHIREDLAASVGPVEPDPEWDDLLVLSTCYQDDTRMILVCVREQIYEY